MKTPLLALSLICSSALIAQNGSNYNENQSRNENGTCSTCCCKPCCCEPCCVPKPPKCIDCECYTPPFYDLQCACGFSVDAEFLYWYARESNLSYAALITAVEENLGDPNNLVYCPQKYKNLKTDWDPGFRVGVGWNSSCDGWDYYVTWTYMHNKRKDSTSVPEFTGNLDLDEQALINPWINAAFHQGLSIQLFDRVQAKWKLQLNLIDLEIGRKYWLSRCFVLRPYAAVRGGWWKTKFRTLSVNTSTGASSTTTATFKDRFTNRVWGVGLLGGLQPTWYFCDNFALFSNFDVALLWGEFEGKKRERYLNVTESSTSSTVNTNYSCRPARNEFFTMTPMLDVALGLRWEECWCCERFRTALDVGWEHHVFFDQNHRIKTSDSFTSVNGSTNFGFKTFDEVTGNLHMGGLVVRLKVDF